MRTTRVGLVAAIVVGALAAGAPPANATHPGLNGLITWGRVRAHQDVELWGLNPTTGEKIQITENTRQDFEPAWSADGQFVAYTSSGDDADVWVANADGTDEHNISNNPDTADRWPNWSPDGEFIVFSRQNFDGTSSIWVMRSDGTEQHELVDDTFANEQPAWSPNGRWIAFASNRGGDFDLYRMAPDGGSVEQLTDTPGAQEANPNWNPHNTQLLFDACLSVTYPCGGFAPNYEIFTRFGNGTVRRLTAVKGIDNNPAWSPDGSQIVFRSDRLRFTALWLMNADGSNPRVLTPGQFNGGVDPDWQPVPISW